MAATSMTHRMEAEDTLGAVLDYGHGRIATLHTTTAAYPGRDEEITIAGTSGTAVLRGTQLTLHQGTGSPKILTAEPGSATAADPSSMPAGWHRAVLDDALTSFAAGTDPLAGGHSALLTQRVIEACYASAADGQWVNVADNERLTGPVR